MLFEREESILVALADLALVALGAAFDTQRERAHASPPRETRVSGTATQFWRIWPLAPLNSASPKHSFAPA